MANRSDQAGLERLTRRVLQIDHNPPVEPGSRRRLTNLLGWYDPTALAEQYCHDVESASGGRLRYQVVDRLQPADFPRKVDGFRYDVATYLRCWRQQRGFHQPDALDYPALLNEFAILPRINSGEIDEVWLFGFPYAGYYESIMVGPDAFWCNAPPLQPGRRLPPCQRRFVIMGFNYEREVGCMLEALGHRAESILTQLYAGRAGPANLWERFTRYDLIAPGQAAVGNLHFAPNSRQDYDWGRPDPVLSDCDDWLNFPTLSGARRVVNYHDWGAGDMRQHHLWWFQHLPRAAGETDGIANNWWRYVGDPNLVP